MRRRMSSKRASVAPLHALASLRKSEKRLTKSAFFAACSSDSPLLAALKSASSAAASLAKPSFTTPAILGESALSRSAGVRRISAKALSFLLSESILRIVSPGRLIVTSATSVSSEKTRSATKSLISAMLTSRGFSPRDWSFGMLAFAMSAMSPTMGSLTVNCVPSSLMISTGRSCTTFASISLRSSGSCATSFLNSSARRSRSSFLISFPSSACSAIFTRMPVLKWLMLP